MINTIGDSRRCVLTSWVGEATAHEARQLFVQHQIPTFDTPEAGVRAFMHMVRYRRGQDLLMETPPSIPEAFMADIAAVRQVIDPALAAGRFMLTGPESQAILRAYGIPVVGSRIAATPAAAAALAADLDMPVAVKILSPDISHKSDVGGVALNLEQPAEVEAAALAMLARVRERRPAARVDGFMVEPMVRRPGAHELILGMAEDAQFGPIILFGQGGVAVPVGGVQRGHGGSSWCWSFVVLS